MKSVYLTIIILFIFVSAYSQEITKTDSTVASLKTYLTTNIHPPAVMMEKHIAGRLIVAFKIDSSKKISDIHFLQPLTIEYDTEVVRVLKKYSRDLVLPPAEYLIGVQFLIETPKHKAQSLPFDKTAYKNFLFDLDVKSFFPY